MQLGVHSALTRRGQTTSGLSPQLKSSRLWAFFPSQFLGGIDFDRSPGTAPTIGPAPFGGSIHLLSKDFSPVRNIRGGISYGSFNTKLFDGEFDSGSLGPGSRINVNLDIHNMTGDGYQTWNHQKRNAGDIKVGVKVSNKTSITGFAGVIYLDANTPNFNATRCLRETTSACFRRETL
jgi:iron complex outermembrane receptor protein